MFRIALLASLALCACTPKAETPAAEAVPEAAAETPRSSEPVVVSAPLAGARISSPLMIAGVAPNDWFFEGVFPMKLLAADGSVISEFPAEPLSDWQVEGPVAFTAAIPFEVMFEQPATLVLEEDMPPEDGEARQLKIPVFLVPGN